MAIEEIGGKRKVREEQGRWKANINDLSAVAESHLEDSASVSSRKLKKRYTRCMETASLEMEGRDAKDGTNTGINTGRGYWNAIPQC